MIYSNMKIFATKFSALCRCATNSHSNVSDYMVRVDDHVVWDPILCRSLMEFKEGQFQEMHSLLNGTYIPIPGRLAPIEGYGL